MCLRGRGGGSRFWRGCRRRGGPVELALPGRTTPTPQGPSQRSSPSAPARPTPPPRCELRGAGRRSSDAARWRAPRSSMTTPIIRPRSPQRSTRRAPSRPGPRLFQPHLYSRTAALAGRFGEALAGADEAVVTEIYAAREQPVEGVTAKLVVDALAERRPGMPLAYEPTSRRLPTTSACACARETWC